MIKIYEDRKYLSDLDLMAIENGVAQLSVHSLRISNFLTDEQKQQNLDTSYSLSRDEWGAYCEQKRKSVADKIEPIIDLLSDRFSIYQYKDESIMYRDYTWDLFFWCNCGDMSYVTLSMNDKQSVERKMETVNAVLECVNDIDVEGIQIAIQYTAVYNNELVNS